MYTEASSCIWLLSVDGNFHAMKLTLKKKKKSWTQDTEEQRHLKNLIQKKSTTVSLYTEGSAWICILE